MPYEISWEPHGIVWTFHGELTGEDATQANLDIYGDPRFDTLRYQIVDILGVEHFNLTKDIMDESASLDEAATFTKPHLVVAVIAATREAIEVAKMYQSAMTTASWKVQVFPNMEEARSWICSCT